MKLRNLFTSICCVKEKIGCLELLFLSVNVKAFILSCKEAEETRANVGNVV